MLLSLFAGRSVSFAVRWEVHVAHSAPRLRPRGAVSISNPPPLLCGALDSRNSRQHHRANSTQMSESEEQKITQVVLDFLKTADMAVTTERKVLAHVQNTLQVTMPLAECKRLVSTVIDDFLGSYDSGNEDAAAAAADDEDEPEPGAASGKGGRKRAAHGAYGDSALKRARSDEDVLFSRNLGPRRKARVRRWQGKLYIDVREFYESEGSEAPTPKGLSMDPGQWARLVRELPALLAAQRAGNTAAPACQLSRTRLAALNTFKGTCYLGLREYYEKDGQLAPTKKGVSLTLEETEALLAAAPDITAGAGGPMEHPKLSAAPTTTTAAPTPTTATAAGGSTGPSAPGPSGAVESGGGGGAQEVVDLGSHKRMSISRYGGRLSVDLREFYEKDGQMLPGKKGIALSPTDWGTLAAHLADVSAALSRKDMKYSLQLSGMRRVSLSQFKGVTYVGVREYYNKGGEEAPSAKGLNMNPQQWAAVVAGAPGISAALQEAQN